MTLNDFNMISTQADQAGLVWSGEVQEGKYFAELQTGIIPQIVHLVMFDMEDDNTPVYNAVQAFTIGDSFDEEAQAALGVAVEEALAVLNA